MIIVSGIRAGLVIGLIVTPPKIQHEQSRWNKKFGSGGRSKVAGSADFHISPASWRTSALVMPPIKNSATVAGSAVSTHSCACREAVIPTCRSFRMWPQTHSLASGWASASASSCSARKTSTPRSRIDLDEHVVLGLGPGHPDHVIEQEVLGVRRGQAGVLQARPVDHDPAQPAYFGIRPQRHNALSSFWLHGRVHLA